MTSYHDEEAAPEEVGHEDEGRGEGEAEAGAHAQEVLDAEVEAVTVVAEGRQQHHRHQHGLKAQEIRTLSNVRWSQYSQSHLE